MSVSAAGLFRALREILVLLGLAMAMAFTGVFVHGQLEIGLFFDFQGTIMRPVAAVLDGANPYPPPVFEAVDTGNPAVYPPLSFLLAVPLLALPFEVAALLWTLALIGCVTGALALLGVRDWRAYGLALTSFPVVGGVVFGNLTIALVLGAALAWRVRRRAVWLGVVVGVVVALKLFLWPLLVWLTLMRRFRGVATAIATAAVGVLGSWALIGFAGFSDYPDLLRVLTEVFAPHSPSLFMALTSWGAPEEAVQAVLIPTAVGICSIAAVGGRRGRDQRVFAAAVFAAVIATPIAWPHYYALLVVLLPLAASTPSPLWLVAPLTWLAGFAIPNGLPTTVPCCKPDHVPPALWILLHGPPPIWTGIAFVMITAMVALAVYRRGGSDIA